MYVCYYALYILIFNFEFVISYFKLNYLVFELIYDVLCLDFRGSLLISVMLKQNI